MDSVRRWRISKSLLAYSRFGRVRVGVACHHGEPVIVPRSQSCLKAVVVRVIDVAHLKDLRQEGKLGVQGAPYLLTRVGYWTAGSLRRYLRRISRVHLVDVANSHQARAVVAHIGHFQHQIRCERVLYVHSPVGDIWSLDIAINPHNCAGPTGNWIAIDSVVARKYGAIPVKRPAGEERDASRDVAAGSAPAGVDLGSGRDSGQSEGVVQSEKGFPVDRFVHNAATRAQHGATFTPDVPGKTEARRKIVAVRIVGTTYPTLPDLHHSLCRIEVAQKVVSFLDDAVHFITQAKVQRYIGSHPKIVLNKACIAPVVNLTGGIANQQSAVGRQAREEVFDSRRVSSFETSPNELDPASAATVGAATERVAMKLSTKFDGMLAQRIGNVIDQLEARVRSLHLGPVKAAQFLRENIEGKNVDAWQPAVERVGDSRVQAIRASDVRGVVIGKGRLVKAVVAKTSFVDPSRIGHEGPALAKHLSASVDLREPFRLQLTGIRNGPRIVAKEIHAAKSAALVEAVIDLTNRVICTHGVGQAEVDGEVGGVGARVEREAAAVASNGVGRRKVAAGNL